MKKSLITLNVLIAYCNISPAQTESSHHLLSPVSFSVAYHTNWYGSNEFQDFNDFISANGISLVPSDVSDFNVSTYYFPYYYFSYGTSQNNLSFLLGFKRKAGFERKSWNEWRIGVTWNSTALQAFSLYRNEFIPGDTFYAEFDTLTIDTSLHENYYYEQRADVLLLNVSKIYFTNPDNRFFFYAGLGVEIGSSINNIIKVTYSKFENIIIRDKNLTTQFSYSGHSGDSDASNELIKTEPVLFFRPYIPLGVGFRFAKKQTLLQHFSLTVRTSFGIEMGKGNETSFTKMFWSLGSGLTYTL